MDQSVDIPQVWCENTNHRWKMDNMLAGLAWKASSRALEIFNFEHLFLAFHRLSSFGLLFLRSLSSPALKSALKIFSL